MAGEPGSGTEVALLNELGQNVCNIFLDTHVEQYPDVVIMGSETYHLVFRGDGFQLAQYQIKPELEVVGLVTDLASDTWPEYGPREKAGDEERLVGRDSPNATEDVLADPSPGVLADP